MYRATTPTHSFIFDIDPDATFRTILITYAQEGDIVLEKGKSDLTFSTTTDRSGSTLYVASLRLTQQETNLFDADKNVVVQLRALTYAGEAVAFNRITVAVRNVLNDEVLT